MIRIPLLALAPLASLAGCGSADPEAVLETVRATEEAQFQAIAANDLRGAVRNYADDAVFFVPGSPAATGGEAIAAQYDTLLADPAFKLDLNPGTGWAAGSDDLAVTTATGNFTRTSNAGEAVTVPVTSKTVWRRSNGEPWRIVSEYHVPAQ